jgi:hypothetical protein
MKWKILLLGTAGVIGSVMACYDGADCSAEGTTYRDGESWVADNCDACECEDGVTLCTAADCSDSQDTGSDSGR